MKKLVFITAALLAFSSCCSKKAESSIADGTFAIVELNGTEYQSLGEKPAFIAFESEKCNASVGGNSIFASYKEEAEGKLTLSESGMTRMMVPEEYREEEFVNAFNAIASYKAEGDTVTFLNAEGAELIKAVKVSGCSGCCGEACEGECCKGECCKGECCKDECCKDECCKGECCDSCKAECCDTCKCDGCKKECAEECCKDCQETADAECAEGEDCCK